MAYHAILCVVLLGLGIMLALAPGGDGPSASPAPAPARGPTEPGSPADAPGAPTNLRCEYLTDPLSVDAERPRLSWQVVDARRGAVQSAYQVLVATSPDLLAANNSDLWDSGRVASDQTWLVEYPETAGLWWQHRQVWWKVRTWDAAGHPSPWSTPATWSRGLDGLPEWEARWIADPVEPPAADAAPPPCLRRSFTLPGAVRRARCYVTALGLYELHINGQRVGDQVLAPEWTDYSRRLQYQTYDVTSLLNTGENVVGVQLGDGWYCGRVGLSFIVPNGPARRIYGDRPKLLLRLDVELADGQECAIVSDESWRSTTAGPIRSSDLLDGETYDARREMPGWDQGGFDDSAWTPVVVPTQLTARGEPKEVHSQPNEPIRVTRELPAKAMTTPAPGTYVYDLGQNMVGWCRLRVDAPAGTAVTLRHAEVLNPDGTIYTANLRAAQQTDRYVCRGTKGGEVFEPHFTYHGFRYVEVTGLPNPPKVEDLTGRVFHSAAPECSTFECSEPLLNRLMQNVLWTQRANLMSVPTDCPQRDERLGWMGDILAFAQTACFNMDMAAFYTKWLADVRDAQTADGRYPDFAPHPFDPEVRFSSVAAWGDAGVFVPWVAYVNYADRRLLERHYESARRWVDYVHAKNPELLWKESRGNDYGDWLNADTLKLAGWPEHGAEMPKEAFATAFFARSTQLVARMARVLGRDADAQRYASLAGDVAAAFRKAYLQPDGTLAGDTQAGYAIALAFDLLEPEQQPEALRRMVAAFGRYNGNIATGFHSTICLMNELTRRGQAEEAYRLLLNRTMPSWLYPVEHGATTIWERWDGYVEGRGFQDPGMNSFAHYAYGCVGEWVFRTIVGLNPDEQHPGYAHFTLRPRPGGGLTWARGTYDSPRGRIACAWRIADGQITTHVTIPPNTTATVYIPTTDPAAVRESGAALSAAAGVRVIGGGAEAAADSHAVCCELAAGSYVFVAPWKP